MKILELCHFTQGACGVWARAREESTRLADKGHEILFLSSNAIKGKDEIAPREESIGKVKIKRFPFKKLGGESFMLWPFEKEALAFRPDVIITHNYRQLHSLTSLRIAKKLKALGKDCKVFLVTHAPFVEGNITRSALQTAVVKAYDFALGPLTLNKFDGILTISHWEEPYLKKMKVRENKIFYIPNGIPEQFFTQKKEKEEHKILFFARVSIKKKVDSLIKAMRFVRDKNVKVEIVGPKEDGYFEYVDSLVDKYNLRDKIEFKDPVYGLTEKIKLIDSAKVFVLPSRVEGMPQSLIEAMARGKLVIGSNSIAIRDLIKDKQNGFLFEFDNPKDLAAKIDMALVSEKESRRVGKNAEVFVQDFNWIKVIDRIEEVITP